MAQIRALFLASVASLLLACAAEPNSSGVLTSPSSRAGKSVSESTDPQSSPAAPSPVQNMKEWKKSNQRQIRRGLRQWVRALSAYGEADWGSYVFFANKAGITLSTVPDSPDGPKASYWLSKAGEALLDASRQFENGYPAASRRSLASSAKALSAYRETIRYSD